jgi:16S rRNA (uracil1498-N3)-methyltransferase
MRISRIYVDLDLRSHAEVCLPAEASHYLLKALRLRVGDKLTIFNGRGGEFSAELVGTAKHLAQLRVGTHDAIERESPLQLTLLQAVSRGERMDYVMQKSAELGVTRVVPVMSEFSVVKLEEKQAAKRVEHWRAIATSACEQCGRTRLPVIANVVDFDQALIDCEPLAGGSSSARLLLSPTASAGLPSIARNLKHAVLLIGPEGGFSDREEQLALTHGFVGYRLGPRLLRTETAPVAAIALLQSLSGDLN